MGTDSIATTEAILESISDGVFTVGTDWCITSFNRAAEKITGVPRDEAIGRRCSEVFRSSMCEGACALGKTLSTGKPIIAHACYIINADGERVPASVSTAVLHDEDGKVIGGAETFRDLSELETLRKEISGRYSLGDMVSHSHAMQPVFELASSVAASDITLLIQGETGTGKELLARAIHGMSTRAVKPFIAINCAALPDTLLESELFGYKKGAFTGAIQDKPGRFAQAADGTVFLDEIGEISPALQVRLLRVLQEHTYEPLGSNTTVHTKARIIAATHRDLPARVKEGSFREDLFYRINVINIELPPLRQRKDDLSLLIEHFIRRFNRIHSKAIAGISNGARSLLMAHDWPGNVRELENIIERAFVLCTDPQIEIKHLPAELRGRSIQSEGSTDMETARRSAESQTILAALEKNGFNRLATARDLNIHKTTLYRKMKALGLHPSKDQ
ncbi:sigma-54 interaction domain-containing protein [Pontiella sulfatireligans]|uniref:Transcriptional regulatory protein ZraR n=1 Tax=Pontiella sulfatireligans TaxID=2750658 RepID=A0A6C2UQ97_9BACT|nr:sigma 54-interacting transcriptional regulator [Pontiella sulfatireligans]VGO22388.1 Transcriptional regulatory protein ZraR [Pontiella sulfatireligans]